MNKVYARQWAINVSDESVNDLLRDHEKILRLSPRWDVKEIRTTHGTGDSHTLEVDVEHDRTEMPVSFVANIHKSFSPESLQICLTSSTDSIEFSIEVAGLNRGKLVSVLINSTPEPDIHDIREFDLWARSIINYLKISASNHWHVRLWKAFLDKWWLNMTQSAKRITFFIVASEGFSVIFLVALLLWWKFS